MKRELPKQPPHMIHGDPSNLYPTHTHGLARVDLPEMFINGSCFGNMGNARVINSLVRYLYLNEEEWDKCVNGEDMEIQLVPKEPDFILCIRKVERNFAGVTTAYYHDDLKCKTGFRQIYVKGDDHVLTDDFFLEKDRQSKLVECGPECSCFEEEK